MLLYSIFLSFLVMQVRFTGFFLFFSSFFLGKAIAQTWRIAEEITMPEAVTNAANTEGPVGDSACVYVFGGLDSTKLYSGIHRRSYRYNTVSKQWLRLPDLPDTLGKIAAAASFVKGKIYHIGGYHVYANSDEKSSNRVHRFDCQANTYINDGKSVPIPIDDHVQAVWRDSLIYIISGWSNVGNVANVQIYNPATDTWLMGNPTPNTNTYKSFGASGVVFKDTIFYLGGASMGSNFPAQTVLRKGIINPANPTEITWSSQTIDKGYRSAATIVNNQICWLGGSEVTYNYNGVAYNGSGGVPPLKRSLCYNPSNGIVTADTNIIFPMDLRGIAVVNDSTRYIAGGMEAGQKVGKKLLKIVRTNKTTATKEAPQYFLKKAFDIFPNPSTDTVFVRKKEATLEEYVVRVFDLNGRLILSLKENSDCQFSILRAGIYVVEISNRGQFAQSQQIMINK
jgi:Secretion system C-terminal sorting domain